MNRSFVCFALPKPANCRMVHGLPRYIVGCTPRVYGNSPGQPRSRSKSKPGRSSGVASVFTAADEIVVKSFFHGGVFANAAAAFARQASFAFRMRSCSEVRGRVAGTSVVSRVN